jgi:hypothetical protein
VDGLVECGTAGEVWLGQASSGYAWQSRQRKAVWGHGRADEMG